MAKKDFTTAQLQILRDLFVGGPAQSVLLLQEAHDDAGNVIGTAPLRGLHEEPLGGLLRVQNRLDHGHGFLSASEREKDDASSISSFSTSVVYQEFVLTSLVTTSHSPSLARMRNSKELSTTSS